MRLELKKVNYDKLCQYILLSFSLLLLLRATMGPMWHMEIDSNVLPAISIQYRGSLLMNEEDLKIAQRDFPTLYAGIDSYDDLRASKLLKITDDIWMSYYFPVYPFACIPVKIFLATIGLAQERAFTITNALLVICSLWVVYRKLKASDQQKFFMLLLLMFSPIVFYVNYICYEAYMFSMITISMVMYQRENYKLSAFFLALAGQSNSAAMAAGIVMIVVYFLKILIDFKGKKLVQIFRDNLKETLCYGVMFTPCLLPFIFQNIYRGKSTFAISSNSFEDYGWRVLSYFFDPNLGIASFAPLQLVFAIICVGVVWKRKTARPIIWGLFLLVEILAVSLMYHINCGMIYCARYIVWIYPILVIMIATEGFETVSKISLRFVVFVVMLSVTAGIFLINDDMERKDREFFTSTKLLLDHVPEAYNPYTATFYNRVLHVDGGYNMDNPVYYLDSGGDNKGQIRKLLYKAAPDSIEEIFYKLTGSEESLAYLMRELEETGLDGDFHYINRSPNSKYQLREKTEEERWEFVNGDILIQEQSIKMNWMIGNYYELSYPIKIKPNQEYRITLKLNDNFDYSNVSNFFLDFYAGNTYDSREQEANLSLQKEKTTYSVYINAGEIPNELDVNCRIIYFPQEYSEQDIDIDLITVQEVQRIVKSDTYDWRFLDDAVYVQNEFFELSWDGYCYLTSFPINIGSDQTYEVTLKLDENVNISDPSTFFVDLYGGSKYDDPRQEVNNFLREGENEYTFSIDTGIVPDGRLDVYFRIIYVPKEYTGEKIMIDTFQVKKV